jgi:hypothetical protein
MEKEKILFDDQYSGERYTYGLQYRPLGYGAVPPGWIIHSNREHPTFSYGTVDYPFKLTEHQIEAFQLREVSPG